MKTRSAKEVEGENGLWEEMGPLLHGEARVEGRQTSNEVVLERLDGTFGGVRSVDVGWSELDREGGGGNLTKDRSRELVVADVDCGGEACTIEKEMDGFHDAAPFRRVTRTHGVGQDGVTFLNIGDGNVTIPRSGSDHGAGEVGEATVGVTEVGDSHMSGGGIARGRRNGGSRGPSGMCGGEA